MFFGFHRGKAAQLLDSSLPKLKSSPAKGLRTTSQRRLTRSSETALNPTQNRFSLKIFVLGSRANGGIDVVLKRLKKEGVQIGEWEFHRLSKLTANEASFRLGTSKGSMLFCGHLKKIKTKDFVAPYAYFRDLAGVEYTKLRGVEDDLSIEFISCGDEEVLGFLVGLCLADYRFKETLNYQTGENRDKREVISPSIEFIAPSTNFSMLRQRAIAIAESMNLARHLVNLPGSILNPESYAEGIKNWFKHDRSMSVRILSREQIEKEGMNLLLAVGRGSTHEPRLVHLKYRPLKPTRNNPIAFIGKGITFDSGGLDIKPASGMRLMKKDMGGSATLVGFAHWLVMTQASFPCDIYLALAENAVDGASYRPGDIIRSRAGIFVEIQNTDAEGRLVMADTMDYALSQKEKPEVLIDFSTLTGAMRVALGPNIAGYFSNDDALSQKIERAATSAGESVWRMPLYKEYFGYLKSHCADMCNSSDSGFAGAITAALFLERFVRDAKWIHFDLFCWNEKARGGCSEIGGNAQGVQTLIHFASSK